VQPARCGCWCKSPACFATTSSTFTSAVEAGSLVPARGGPREAPAHGATAHGRLNGTAHGRGRDGARVRETTAQTVLAWLQCRCRHGGRGAAATLLRGWVFNRASRACAVESKRRSGGVPTSAADLFWRHWASAVMSLGSPASLAGLGHELSPAHFGGVALSSSARGLARVTTRTLRQCLICSVHFCGCPICLQDARVGSTHRHRPPFNACRQRPPGCPQRLNPVVGHRLVPWPEPRRYLGGRLLHWRVLGGVRPGQHHCPQPRPGLRDGPLSCGRSCSRLSLGLDPHRLEALPDLADRLAQRLGRGPQLSRARGAGWPLSRRSTLRGLLLLCPCTLGGAARCCG